MVWKVVAAIRSAKQEPNKIPFLFTIKVKYNLVLKRLVTMIRQFNYLKNNSLSVHRQWTQAVFANFIK